MKTKAVTMSLHKDVVQELDKRRGEISRSRFVERLLETALAQKETDRAKENDEGRQRGYSPVKKSREIAAAVDRILSEVDSLIQLCRTMTLYAEKNTWGQTSQSQAPSEPQDPYEPLQGASDQV